MQDSTQSLAAEKPRYGYAEGDAPSPAQAHVEGEERGSRTGLPSVHFLTDELLSDACVRYRCEHLQEQLGLAGGSSSLTRTVDSGPATLRGDVLVLNRAGYSNNIRPVIEAARAHGKPLVFGSDDLIFTTDLVRKGIHHAEFFGHSGDSVSEGMRAWAKMQDYVRDRAETLAHCDCAIVSTEYLAERVREQEKPAFVIRNGLSHEMERLSRAVRRDRSRTGGRVMLGYLSGTATHNADFGDIAPVLVDLMARHWNVYLTVVGPMALPEEFGVFGSRVRRMPFVPWRDLPGLIGDLDINLAPLDMFQAFNHGKSEIKWMDAGAVGVPTVASATAGFREAVRDGQTGFLASTPQEWTAALEALVQDAGLRLRVGEAARADVYRRYTAEAVSPHTAQVFREIAERFTQPVTDFSVPLVVPASNAVAPSQRAARALQHLRRGGGQTLRNTRRVLSPYFWERLLERSEGGERS